MTIARPVPDSELALVTYLLADDELNDLVGNKVATELDAPLTLPRVRLWRSGGIAGYPNGHLDKPRIQVESWAASKKAAMQVAGEALRALFLAPDAAHAGAVITDVVQDLPLQWLPDPETDTPRYIFGVALTVHAKS